MICLTNKTKICSIQDHHSMNLIIQQIKCLLNNVIIIIKIIVPMNILQIDMLIIHRDNRNIEFVIQFNFLSTKISTLKNQICLK